MERIGPISLVIPSPQIGPLIPKLPIVQQTRHEASPKTLAARAAAIALWVDIRPAELRGHPATADKRALRETRMPLADAVTAVVAVMPNAAGAVEMVEAEEIKAAEKRVNEEFQ